MSANEVEDSHVKVNPDKKQKRKIQRNTFKPDHLMRPTGLQALYQKSKVLKINDDNDYKNLTQITNLIRSWHYSVMPKYSLNLFLDRCQALGNNNKILQHFLNKARRVHKGEDTWQPAKPEEDKHEFEEPINIGDHDDEEQNSTHNRNGGQVAAGQQRELKQMTIMKLSDSESDDQDLQQLFKRNNLLKPAKKQVSKQQEMFEQESIGDYMPPDFQDDFE